MAEWKEEKRMTKKGYEKRSETENRGIGVTKWGTVMEEKREDEKKEI
jgi:hypothetical protein